MISSQFFERRGLGMIHECHQKVNLRHDLNTSFIFDKTKLFVGGVEVGVGGKQQNHNLIV